MKKRFIQRLLPLFLTAAIIATMVITIPFASLAKTGVATDIGWPSFINLDPDVLNPNVALDPTSSIREAIYQKDAATGDGTSFYIDRVLNRPGTNNSDRNTVLTRGRSIFSVQGSVPTALGWSNNVVWLDTANSFNPLNVITFRNGTDNVSFTEQSSSRNNNPSHWSSRYTTTNTTYSNIEITAKKYISFNNVAVVILDIVNNGENEVGNINFSISTAACNTLNQLPTGQPELTGVKTVRAGLTNLFPRITADIDGQSCNIENNSLITPTITIQAGEKAQLKVVMGITTNELKESVEDYLSIAEMSADEAFKTQVQQYNKWYADTIPYIDIPNKAVQKAIEYRWWLEQYNTFDASIPGYDFQYPDTMEGVLGYNNAIVLTECMRLQDTKWMRSAYLPYGTILNIGNASMSSAFLDNPGKIANWNNHYGQYIAQSGLEAYKVHGGDTAIAEAFAYYFENDAKGQLLHYGQHLPVNGRPSDSENNYGNAYLIAYRNGYMTGNDADALDMSYRNAGTWKIRPESAYVYAAAAAASELYELLGNSSKASEMSELAGKIQQDALDILWSDNNKTFQSYAVSPNSSFVGNDPDKPNLIPAKTNNHYNFFATNLVPKDPDSIEKYVDAFEYFKYADEYPIFPCYTANQVDVGLYGSGSNNFSNINFTLQARAYEAALRYYDPQRKYVTPEMLSMLTAWQAYEVYPTVNGAGNTLYPNNNEYFYGYNPTTKSYSRSGIYHDTLGNFNYIFIEDMAGIRPRADHIIELAPIDFNPVNNELANAGDFKYDHFMVNNIKYHGSDLSIVWDDPSNDAPSYNAPQGYSLYIDGELMFTVDHLAKILYDTETGALTVDGAAVESEDVIYLKTANIHGIWKAEQVDLKLDINPKTTENLKKSGIDLENNLINRNNLAKLPGTVAEASFTADARSASWFEKHRADGTDSTSRAVNEEPPSPAAAIDGTTVGQPFWGNNLSPNSTDWLTITFPSNQTFNNVKIFFYNDRDGFGSGTVGRGYAEPVRYTIEYLKDGEWHFVKNNNKTPILPAANFNDALFDKVNSNAIRISVTNNGDHPVAISEVQVFNSPLTAEPVINTPPIATGIITNVGNLSAELLGIYVDDGLPEDKSPIFNWTVLSSPDGAYCQIENANEMNAKLIGDTEGAYEVKFSASDGEFSNEFILNVLLIKKASADVAPSATTSASYTAGWENVNGPNNESFEPTTSAPGTGKGWGNWDNGAPAWFQYTWDKPVYINSSDIYWYDDNGGTRVPSNWSIQYSNDGITWSDVDIDPSTPYTGSVTRGQYNNLKFAAITMRYLRVYINSITNNQPGTGILRWKVYGPVISKIDDLHIMTPIGTIPELPDTLKVTFDTGAMMPFPVQWGDIEEENVAEERTFIVTGTTLGTLVKAHIYVRTDANIAQITDVWPMSISTATGIPPIYPEYADVSYNNGGRSNTTVPVVWNEDDKALVDYNTAGVYSVRGTVQKGDESVEAILTVNVIFSGIEQIVSVVPVDVITEAGTAPVLPTSVVAKYNNGSEKSVDVTWDSIDEDQYANEGSFIVEGTIDGTSVKAQATVTVTAQPAVLSAIISGKEIVKPNEEFTLNIGLEHLTEDIYAEDISISFDSSKFEYVKAEAADASIEILDFDDETEGLIRLILTSVDGINGESIQLLTINFKVSEGVEDTSEIISVTDAKLGKADGSILSAILDSHEITIEKAIDKTILGEAIDNAQEVHDAAVEGDKSGQYPVGSKAILLAAIEAANNVFNNSDATQEEVDEAVSTLNASVDQFIAKKLTRDIGDVNDNGQVNIGDLAIVAYYYGTNSSAQNWPDAKACDFNGDGKVDILDLAYVALKILL